MRSKASAVRTVRLGLPLLAAALATACGAHAGSTANAHIQHAAATVSGTPAANALLPAATLGLSDGHLVDHSGRTVYLWEADHAGKSACSGACATVWPPVTVAGIPTVGTGPIRSILTVIARTDGAPQLVYDGHPLYYFAGDSTPGQTHGQGSDGFGARWWELTATGRAITAVGTLTTPAHTTSSSAGGYGY